MAYVRELVYIGMEKADKAGEGVRMHLAARKDPRRTLVLPMLPTIGAGSLENETCAELHAGNYLLLQYVKASRDKGVARSLCLARHWEAVNRYRWTAAKLSYDISELIDNTGESMI